MAELREDKGRKSKLFSRNPSTFGALPTLVYGRYMVVYHQSEMETLEEF